MQSITIPANATASELFNLCQSNGVTFPGFRAKQAKAKYIVAIESFNAAITETIDTVIGSDFTQGMIEATEISNDRFVAPIVTPIAKFTTITAIAVWDLLTCPRALAVYRDTLIGFVLAMVAVYEWGRDMWATYRTPAYHAAIKGSATIAAHIVTRGRRYDWQGQAVAILVWVILTRRSLVANGNLWAQSQGA
jgi:hypothetical protein